MASNLFIKLGQKAGKLNFVVRNIRVKFENNNIKLYFSEMYSIYNY